MDIENQEIKRETLIGREFLKESLMSPILIVSFTMEDRINVRRVYDYAD
jgi:hypothetical protein